MGSQKPSELDTPALKLSDQIPGEPSVESEEVIDQHDQADKDIWELVYSIENLRKRGGMGDEVS